MTRTAQPRLLIGAALVAAILAHVGGHSPLRAIVVGVFLATVPGGAVVVRLQLAERLETAVLAVALSLAIATVAAEAMALVRAWSPTLLIDLLAIAVVGALWRRSAPSSRSRPPLQQEDPGMSVFPSSHVEEVTRLTAELEGARTVERQLRAEIDALRRQSAAALNPSQRIDALGEEVANVLRSAYEAAEEIRRKAEADAASLRAAERARLAQAWVAVEKLFEQQVERPVDAPDQS